MVLKEIRCVLPFNLEEFRTGHLYGTHRFRHRTASKTETRVADARRYKSDSVEGIFTHKQFIVAKFLPAWAQKILNTENLSIETQCWDEYPRIRVVYSIPMASNKLTLSMDTLFVDNDRGNLDNALQLSPEELKQRQVERCDIADDKTTDMLDPVPEDDPKLFTSKKTGRGPLRLGWQDACTPVMCAYTVIRCDVQMWVVKRQAEEFIVKNLQEVWLKHLRLTFCWIDEWIEMPYEKAVALECEGFSLNVVPADRVPFIPELSTTPRRPAATTGWSTSAATPSSSSNSLQSRSTLGSRLREKIRSKL